MDTSCSKWSDLIDTCLSKVAEKWPDTPIQDKPVVGGKQPETVTGILYSGNLHETVPKQLLLDSRLTPIERNAWQVFKLLLDKQGFAAPRYEDLQPYLSMTPYGEKASKETIAKTIHILRLTGWLSLINKGRDKNTGQLLGSIYILHDEPLTTIEALQLDKNYIDYVVNCCKHANKNVLIVANAVLDEFKATDDVMIKTKLEQLADRIQRQSFNTTDQLITPRKPIVQKNSLVRNINDQRSDAEPSKTSPVRNNLKPSSESEPSSNTNTSSLVRNPNSYSTSTVNINISTSTVIDHPKLKDMNKQQQLQFKELTMGMANDLMEQVINEFKERCDDSIKNPIGYFFALLRKAKNNEFKPWKSSSSTPVITQNELSIRSYRRDTSEPVPDEVKQQISDLKMLFAVNKT